MAPGPSPSYSPASASALFFGAGSPSAQPCLAEGLCSVLFGRTKVILFGLIGQAEQRLFVWPNRTERRASVRPCLAERCWGAPMLFIRPNRAKRRASVRPNKTEWRPSVRSCLVERCRRGAGAGECKEDRRWGVFGRRKEAMPEKRRKGRREEGRRGRCRRGDGRGGEREEGGAGEETRGEEGGGGYGEEMAEGVWREKRGVI